MNTYDIYVHSLVVLGKEKEREKERKQNFKDWAHVIMEAGKF